MSGTLEKSAVQYSVIFTEFPMSSWHVSSWWGKGNSPKETWVLRTKTFASIQNWLVCEKFSHGHWLTAYIDKVKSQEKWQENCVLGLRPIHHFCSKVLQYVFYSVTCLVSLCFKANQSYFFVSMVHTKTAVWRMIAQSLSVLQSFWTLKVAGE